jgi:steroid delta-isomerase-like uncharacterized protein
MSIERNKQTVRRFFEEVYNQGNLAALHEIVAPDFTIDSTHAPDLSGPARAAHAVEAMRRAFPDLRFTVEELIGEGETVAVRLTWRGTHRGTFLGVAPTGRVVEVEGIEVVRLRDAQIVGGWHLFDALGALRQMGAREIPGG